MPPPGSGGRCAPEASEGVLDAHHRFGQALRRAIESYPEDLRVAIVATGGLSHQVHGEHAGFNNTAWDHRFLDLFESDLRRGRESSLQTLLACPLSSGT